MLCTGYTQVMHRGDAKNTQAHIYIKRVPPQNYGGFGLVVVDNHY